MNKRPKITKSEHLAQEIVDQERWLIDRGASREGYVEYYGSRNDPEHYGEGGEAIFLADVECYAKLQALYQKMTGRPLFPGDLALSRLAHDAGALGRYKLAEALEAIRKHF